MKKIIILDVFIFTIFLTLTGLIVSADSNLDIKLPKHTTEFYIYDETNTLNENTKEFIVNINNQLKHLSEGYLSKSQIVVVMINSLEGFDIESYANRLFNEWEIGDHTKDNGILLLIAKDDGEVRIEVGYGLEHIITDSVAGRILDNQVLPHLADKDFNAGILSGFVEIVELISKEDGITIEGLEVLNNESNIDVIHKSDNSESISIEDLSSLEIFIILMLIPISLFIFLLTMAPFVIIVTVIILSIKNGQIEVGSGSSSHGSSGSRGSSSSRGSSGSSSSRGGGGRSGGGGSSRSF